MRSDISDPIERLGAIQRETLSGKQAAERLGLDMIMNVLDVAPPLLAKALVDCLILRMYNRLRVHRGQTKIKI